MPFHRRRDHRARKRSDRGAILILTSISLISLMAFTAFAVDMGQRNQQLAGAQHAIDASVLTAAEYLSRHPADYTGAADLVKELVRQNLGISASEWADCDDPDHLSLTAPNDTNCISFRPIAATTTANEKYDIRVKLPNFKMRTVFGSALGIDVVDLAATAASNGNNCPVGEVCDGGGGTTTTTARVKSPEEQSCWSRSTLQLMYDDALWAVCGQWFPHDDRDAWQIEFCAFGTVTLPRVGGVTENWTIGAQSPFVWYWTTVCSKHLPVSARDAWLNDVCFNNLPMVYGDIGTWNLCKAIRPGLQDMAGYLATTTTTQAPSTTRYTATTAPPTQPTTTIGVPASSTPTSIDLSG